MRKNHRAEPTIHQIGELLCDWGIPPTDYRIDMTRAFLLHRRGFELAVVIAYLEGQGYINDPVRLAWEIRPFFHRKALRSIKGLMRNGHHVKRYTIVKPRVENTAYVSLFKRQGTSWRHCIQRHQFRKPATLMQY